MCGCTCVLALCRIVLPCAPKTPWRTLSLGPLRKGVNSGGDARVLVLAATNLPYNLDNAIRWGPCRGGPFLGVARACARSWVGGWAALAATHCNTAFLPSAPPPPTSRCPPPLPTNPHSPTPPHQAAL